MPIFFPLRSSGFSIPAAGEQKMYGWICMRNGKIGRAMTGSLRQRAIMYQDSDISAMSNSSYTGRMHASPLSARHG